MTAGTGTGRAAPLWRRATSRALDGTYFRRRVTTPDGVFDALLSPGSQLRVLDPRGVPLEAAHLRFIARWIAPDAVVWDVGGNLGLFAFPAALKARAGRTIVFEPDIDIARLLMRSAGLRRNRALAVSVVPVALADRDGVSELLISAYGRAMNKIAGMAPWHDHVYVSHERRQVPTFRVDTLARQLAPPTVIKIDVEGAEMQVLAGGRETIARQRPVLLIEVPQEIGAALAGYFAELDYVLTDALADDLRPIETPVWDTVAVPRERMQ